MPTRPLLERAVADLEEIGPAGDQQRWELLTVLAAERRHQGRTAEAWELHQRVRRLVVRLYGEEHPTVAGADFDLALDLLADPSGSRRAEAAALLIRARDRLLRVDPQHTFVPQIERELAALRGS